MTGRRFTGSANSIGALQDAEPDLPDDLDDRAADNWRALVAIADAAGGVWSARSRAAVDALSGDGATKSDSIRELLLRDLRELFDELGDKIATAIIVERLGKMEERPWPEWGKSKKAITPTALAGLLKPFGIGPGTVYLGRDDAGKETSAKGYDRTRFNDLFDRYIPSPRKTQDSEPSGSQEAHGTTVSTDFADVRSEQPDGTETAHKSLGDTGPDGLTAVAEHSREKTVFDPRSGGFDDLEEGRGVLADLRELDANPRLVAGSVAFEEHRVTDSVRARLQQHREAVIAVLASEAEPGAELKP